MITEISLQNFKCFEKKHHFSLSKINLLTGINGRGKSSLLQAILLLSQTFRKQKNSQELTINGEWVNLGTFEDIKNSDSKDKVITIEIKTDDSIQNSIRFIYEELPENERIANLKGLFVDEEDKFVETTGNSTETIKEEDKTIIHKKALMPVESINAFKQFQNFSYVSADRLGPIEYVQKNNNPESLNVGIRGENLINVLAYNGDKKEIPNIICKNNGVEKTLYKQAIEWLAYIFDGANINIKKEKERSIIELFLNSCSTDKSYKPINVGFGYSYILPIIVSCLVSKGGDIMIIENPEAHLHPKAQSRLTEFLAIIASSGVQIFIESHSEHILNGLRVSALKSNIEIETKDLSIYYFGENFEPQKLDLKEDGKISNWPLGFFDQQDFDLSEIFKLSRRTK